MRILLLCLALLFSLFIQGQIQRVAFLGNSYTQYNNLPQLIADCASSVGDSLETERSTPGGYTLEAHSTNENSLALIMQGNWDFVVLQEQSQRPSFPIEQVEEDVFPYALLLDSVNNAYNPCGESMLYMTWGRKNGDASNCGWWPPVCTYLGMDSLLHLRYMMMADSNDAVVSPVGAVWRYIRQTYPNIELYAADESHPSLAGSYAAACSFYTAIYKKDPTLITYHSTLDPATATNIRMAAKLVVFDNLSHWFLSGGELVSDFSYEYLGGYTYQFTNLSENASGQLWDFGAETDTTTHPIYTFPGAGIYNVVLSSFNACDTIERSRIIAVIETGVNQDNTAGKWLVYPNPIEDMLYLQKNTPGDVSVEFFNLKGELMMSQDRFSGNTIDVSGLAGGTYFIKIKGGNKSITKKIFKN